MLKSLGFYQRDTSTGEKGFTLGALLLFGKDETIYTNIAYYRTDAILRIENINRYDDREIVTTNLIDAFDILMQFIRKHLPDPFYLEDGIHRLSLRDKIFREVISNILIHREYSSPYHAKLIIEKRRVVTENANRAYGFGHITPQKFTPFPKNPKIARLFREIGRADELGSGVRNIFNYTPIYSKGGEPQLIERDIFQIIIPLTPEIDHDINQKTVEKGSEKGSEKSSEKSSEKIITYMKEDKDITILELSQKLKISTRAVEKHIAKLKKERKIRRVGADKGGYWEVLD